MVLGGVCDEVEICGYCCIYIGFMLGKLIQKMVKVGVKNLLFLFDEIDKMFFDMCGDLVFVLFEVLDLEQNVVFSDYYLEVDYDFSDVMFVVMLNFMNILVLLLDCMEVICFFGYIEDEKLNIVKCYLLLKQIECNVLKKGELIVDDSVIIGIICYYICEVGVCGLECEIFKLCCKVVKQLLFDKLLKYIEINGDNLYDYFGVQCFDYGCVDNENCVGQVIGLVWMEVGGDLLIIEIVCVLGKGKLIYIGLFGEVMQEFIQVVLMVVCVCVEKLGINFDFYEKCDIYVYVLEGVMLKDGLSVGIVMCIVLVFCLIGNLVCVDVVMIGEIILCGQVLLIGGLKEKFLVVYCGGIKIVLILFENKCDLEEIFDNVIVDLDIYFVKCIEEVLILVL